MDRVVSRRMISSVCLAALCMGLSGCLIVGAKTEKKAPDPTVGQELIDLQTAHEKGALTDEEYNRAKQRVLGRMNCDN